MTSSAAIEGLVQALVQARQDQRPAEAAAWAGAIGDNAAQAYAVQQGVADALGWFALTAAAARTARARCRASGSPAAARRSGPLTHAPLPPEGVRPSLTNLSDMHFNAPVWKPRSRCAWAAT